MKRHIVWYACKILFYENWWSLGFGRVLACKSSLPQLQPRAPGQASGQTQLDI